GRARQGSIRAPHWMGGGSAHGPHPRSYEMRVNRKMKKAALRSALSDAAASGKLSVLDALRFEEPRTKDAAAVVDALGLHGRILVVLPGPDQVVEKSFRNLPFVRIDFVGNLSTYDVLLADRVLFTAAALDVLEGREPAEEPEGSEEPDGSAEQPEEAIVESEDASEGEGEEAP
ncbi:MAG TPA: 50S ribosomal protein L4, partial [Actinomycetota bacterium]|nr:50S ribosomal protein L4 [Actinomycetota bacterium]